jgi:hypothetical protein
VDGGARKQAKAYGHDTIYSTAYSRRLSDCGPPEVLWLGGGGRGGGGAHAIDFHKTVGILNLSLEVSENCSPVLAKVTHVPLNRLLTTLPRRCRPYS